MNRIINKLIFAFFTVFLLLLNPLSFADSITYDYTSTKYVPIRLSITENISTKNSLQDGQKLQFRVVENVFYQGKLLIKKNTLANATLETVVTSGMNGFPAEIIIDNFEFLPYIIPKNAKSLPSFSNLASNLNVSNDFEIKNTQLVSTITKKGQNRALLVYPLKWALTPIPFVGSLTNFIKGGHARLTIDDVVTIYYYPEWK